MSRQSSIAHTKGQILRELMGRANFMSRDVRLAKHANERENGRLRETIEGKHGINSQRRHMVDRVNLEADAVRHELAQTKYRRKLLNPLENRRTFDAKIDPLELLMLEKVEMRMHRNEKLLRRLKSRSERAESRVKEFIEKIERDIKKQNQLPVIPEFKVMRLIHQEQLISRPSSASDKYLDFRETSPEDLTPDGKPRAKLTLPNIEESWEDAKRARYIRTRIIREFERELTFKEIFEREGFPPLRSN